MSTTPSVPAALSVPSAPGALPLIGHGLALARDPIAFLQSLSGRGDLVEIRVGPVKMFVVCDPELTRGVLLDDRTFDKGGPAVEAVREVAETSIVTSTFAAHRRLRRAAQPAFHRARIPRYAEIMSAEIDAATAEWAHGQVLDVTSEMLALTMRIIAGTMFSGTLPPDTLRQAIADLMTILPGMYRRAMTPPLLKKIPLPADRRHFQARARLHRTVEHVIAERRADGAEHDDLLSALLAASGLLGTAPASDDSASSLPDSPPTAPTLTDSEVTDQVFTFFAAGSETASSLLSWALHVIAADPEIEQRLHAEVDTVLAGAPAALEHLPKLELTSRIITETLRLYPPTWFITRTVTADTVLGAHELPAGTDLVYSPYLVHHNADLYDHPDRFDPDRWIGAPSRPHAYIPFGSGARKCIGDQFGILETTLALATITSRWTLQPVDPRPVRSTVAITLKPRNLRMKATARIDPLA